ncbi:35716_t:CDS:2, partial [Gigaspora margarita]
ISNNSLASSISYDKTISSQKKIITPPSDSTPSRNLGSNQPTEADSKTSHMIRMNATNNKINELHNLIEKLENSYMAKYYDRTTEQRFDNPDSWLIGDLPVITSEINRVEHEANYVKTTKDIKLLMYTPSTITVGRRGILQSRIKERLETTFKALEAQLNALHEQIQEKTSNKSQSPLEYIDRSIRNISKGLYRNASQIEQLSVQLDQLTLQISSEDHDSNHETSQKAAYLNKERICEKPGIQETNQTTEVAHTEIESLSFGERLTGSPLSFGEKFLESDKSNLTRASFISQDNETTQEPLTFLKLSKTSELKQSYNNFWEESKPSVPQMAPDTTTEEIVAENGNALIEVSENFSSFALGEPTKEFNAFGLQGDFGLFGERSSVNVSTSAPAFGKPTPFAAATSAPIAFGAGLSASDNASGIPLAFATPPNN